MEAGIGEMTAAQVDSAAVDDPTVAVPPAFWARVTGVFAAIDSNFDGELTVEELTMFFEEHKVQHVLDQMDWWGDQSGTVSMSEWRAYFQHMIDENGLTEAEVTLAEMEA